MSRDRKRVLVAILHYCRAASRVIECFERVGEPREGGGEQRMRVAAWKWRGRGKGERLVELSVRSIRRLFCEMINRMKGVKEGEE